MSVFTNQLFSTGSFTFNREDAADNLLDAHVSIDLDAAGNITASFDGKDKGTYVGDVKLLFGSAKTNYGPSQGWSDFFIRRKNWQSVPGMDAGYELRIGQTSHSYYSGVPKNLETDTGISVRQSYSSQNTDTVPFWIGGGLNGDPFNDTENYAMKGGATLVLSATNNVDSQRSTIFRLANTMEMGQHLPRHLFGSHIQFKRGGAYYQKGGNNVWMGTYDVEFAKGAYPPKTVPHGAFYMALGGGSSYAYEPPKLSDQGGSTGFQFLFVTQSANGGSGGNHVAKTMIGGAYTTNATNQANAFIRPSGSLHVLQTSGQNNYVTTYDGQLVDEEDYTLVIESLSSGYDTPSGGGHCLIGLKSGREKRGLFNGPYATGNYQKSTMTCAIGVINWYSGDTARQTDTGDFFIGLIDDQRENANVTYQEGPQPRVYLTSSGSMSIFSGSTFTNTQRLQFPPSAEYLMGYEYPSTPTERMPTGSLNLFSADGLSPTMNLVNFKDNGTSGAAQKGDVLGHVAFRSFVRTGYKDGLGALIEAKAAHDWDLTDSDRPTELNFYTRKIGGQTLAARIDENKDLHVLGNIQSTNNISCSGSLFIGASLMHMDDVNTRLTFDTDDIEMATGGNVVFHANSSQEVGVGQSAVSGYGLASAGNMSIGGDLKIGGNDVKDSGDNTVISFDGSGNIDSLGTIESTMLVSGSNTSKIRMQHVSTSDANGPELTFRRTDHSGLTSGSNIGEIWFSASEDNTSFGQVATIVGETDGDFTYNSSQPGRLTFYTVSGDATGVSERVRINSAGNMGVGTTVPDCRLSVVGGNAVEYTARIRNTSTSSTANTLKLMTGPSTVSINNRWISFQNSSGVEKGYLIGDGTGGAHFQGSAASVSDMRIKSDVEDYLGTSGISLLEQVDVISYTLNTDPTSTPRIGFSAQQLETIFPSMVISHDNIDPGTGEEYPVEHEKFTPKAVVDIKLLPVAIAAIKELHKTINDLKSEIELLKSGSS